MASRLLSVPLSRARLAAYYSVNTPQHRVSAFDGMILRLTGVTKEPVTEISIEKMEKATSRFRIGLMFFMMGFSVIGSVYAIVQGKREKAAHMSVSRQNRERHAKLKDSNR